MSKIIIPLVAALVILVYLPGVFGDSHEAELGRLDILISAQKGIMSDADKEIKQSQDNLRQVKKTEGKSWDFLPNIKAAQERLDTSVQKGKDARVKYIELLKEKSNLIKQNKEIKQKEPVQVYQGKRIIGLQISEKCINMIKKNYTTTCPTYLDLRKFDSSIQSISGYFVNDGIYHRSNPILTESWRYYDHDNTPRIIVNPPNGMADRYPLIIIESNFGTYLQADSLSMKQSYTIINKTKTADNWGRNSTYSGLNKTVSIPVMDNIGTRVIYHDWFVDSRCKEAMINSDKWETLLPEIIKYLQNSCASTDLVNKEIIVKNYTTHDITTSQKYKDEQRLKWIKENCLKVYGSCKT